jgi:hypothetical protein
LLVYGLSLAIRLRHAKQRRENNTQD